MPARADALMSCGLFRAYLFLHTSPAHDSLRRLCLRLQFPWAPQRAALAEKNALSHIGSHQHPYTPVCARHRSAPAPTMKSDEKEPVSPVLFGFDRDSFIAGVCIVLWCAITFENHATQRVRDVRGAPPLDCTNEPHLRARRRSRSARRSAPRACP